MIQDNIEIRYDGANPFDGICHTPLVDYGAVSDGWWFSKKQIKLVGQILTCGLSVSQIFQKQTSLMSNFRQNFKTFQIVSLDGKGGKNNDGLLIESPFAFIKQISFDDSDYQYVLGFTIDIECHDRDSFSGKYWITDPVYTTSYQEYEDGSFESVVEISAKGIFDGNIGAFERARAWVIGQTKRLIGPVTSFVRCDPFNPGSTLNTVTTNSGGETIAFDFGGPLSSGTSIETYYDVGAGTYKQVFRKKIKPGDKDETDPETGETNGISTQYSVSVSSQKNDKNQVTGGTVTVNGSVTADTREIAQKNIPDTSGIAQRWAQKILTITLPDGSTCTSTLTEISKSNSESAGGKTISFSKTYKVLPCDKEISDPCIETDRSYSYSASGLSSKSKEASYSLSVTATARGLCGTKEERRIAAEEALGGLDVSSGGLEGVPPTTWKATGTGRSLNSDSASITAEYSAKTPKGGAEEEDDNNLPCDIESVDGSMTESPSMPLFNYKRALCEDWLAFPAGKSPYRKTANLNIKYKKNSSEADNYAKSLLVGDGALIKSIRVHDTIEKTISYDYEWELWLQDDDSGPL